MKWTAVFGVRLVSYVKQPYHIWVVRTFVWWRCAFVLGVSNSIRTCFRLRFVLVFRVVCYTWHVFFSFFNGNPISAVLCYKGVNTSILPSTLLQPWYFLLSFPYQEYLFKCYGTSVCLFRCWKPTSSSMLFSCQHSNYWLCSLLIGAEQLLSWYPQFA